MESRFVSLMMLGLVAAMVTARLWVQERTKQGRTKALREENSSGLEDVAEGWEEKGDICEWWS
jgi:hypothetical protein